MSDRPLRLPHRLEAVTRLDLRPVRPLPSLGRIALAGAVACVASVVACVALSTVGQAILSPPAYFDQFHPPGYIALTVVGVAGATVGWTLLLRLTSQPRWCLEVAAVVVTLVLLLPDVALLPRDPFSDVLVLMVEHVVIAAITTPLLLAVLPTGALSRQRRSRRPADRTPPTGTHRMTRPRR